MWLQLGVATTRCGYNWVWLQLGAAQPRATQLGADTTGRGQDWVRLQLGADTTGPAFNWLRLQWVRYEKEFLMCFVKEHCLAACKDTLILLQYISHFPAVRQRYAMTLEIGKYLSMPVMQKKVPWIVLPAGSLGIRKAINQ